MELTEREVLLLRAALSTQPEVAVRSWQHWAAMISLDDAPGSEVRVLPAVLANLKQIAPSFELPKKLHGQAKATFAKSHNLLFHSSDLFAKLSAFCLVMPIKGLAMQIRFGASASRPMEDIDIHVPPPALGGALKLLEQSGWTPRYGMTYASLRHRSCLHRESWNFVNGSGHIDLHWRLPRSRQFENLEPEMWDTAETVSFNKLSLVIQSPEYAFVIALHHGFLRGQRSDALQTIIDSSWLLPRCNPTALIRLIRRASLIDQYARLEKYIHHIEVPNRSHALPSLGTKSGKQRASARPPLETALLRRPALTRIWNALGRTASIERLLIRWFGPFSRPLKPAAPRLEYDLRDCAVIDEIGGPGWAWPDPRHTGFWSGLADVRLLIPLIRVDDYLVIISFENWHHPGLALKIYANGRLVAQKRKSEAIGTICVTIPRSFLFGSWVELSFRLKPNSIKSRDHDASGALVRRLRILGLRHITEVFSGAEVPDLGWRLLRNEEPHVSKLARITAKMENSPYKTSPDLPTDFNPLRYVLSYPDLFEFEVDPYKHFLFHGRHEGRVAW